MTPRRIHHKDRLEPVLGHVDPVLPEIDPRISTAPQHARDAGPGKDRIDDDSSRQDSEIRRSAIVLASLLLLISTIVIAVDQLFSPESFEIEELRIIADLDHLSHEQIRREVLPLIQNNYFAVDLKNVEQKVKAIDWVDQVSVRRQWPRSIHIRLTEQKPVAHWGTPGLSE